MIVLLLILLVWQCEGFLTLPVDVKMRQDMSYMSRRRLEMMSDTIDVTKDGQVTKTVTKENAARRVEAGDIVAVEYVAYLSGSNTPIAQGEQEQVVVADGSMIRGWDEAITSMNIGESATFAIKGDYGYGAAGIPGVVPPNAHLKVDIKVLAWLGNSLNPESLFSKDLDIDPFISSTPEAIQRDYDKMQQSKEVREKYKGSIVDIYLRRIRNISFGFGGSGFFVSQSGEKAPWYLNPNLTFPAMILITIGAAAVTFSTGSIKEKGVKVSDIDLDVAAIVRMDDRSRGQA